VRAARLHKIGGVPVVDEIETPQGDTLTVSAAGLNPVDVTIGSGRFYGGVPETPYVIGSEVVGTVKGGQRVWLYARGSMAEYLAPAHGSLITVPDGIDDATAIACGVAGLTAWLAVSWRAPIRPDDTVLVLGASGSLGAVAVQAAKLLGAARVIGAGRRVEHVPGAADDVVDLSAGGALPEATVIIDGLWGEPLERALAAAAHDVRVVQLGQSAGPNATLASNCVRGKTATILGHALHACPPGVREQGYWELCEHVRDGRIAIPTETYALDEIGAAWERQSTGSPGAKLVIAVG